MVWNRLFMVLSLFGTGVLFAQDADVFDDSFFEEVQEAESSTISNSPNDKVANAPSANSAPANSDVTVIEGLSVEDAGLEESAPVDAKIQAESVKVLETKELQGSSATVADVTNRASGVKVRQAGGLGGESKINIRGMEGKNVKVLMDGVPIDNGNGNLSVNDIPIDKIDRIEIYKSYVPERFSTDGMGGVINIVTTNLPKTSISGSYSFGSFNTHKASLDAKYVWTLDSIKKRSIETGISAYYNYSDNDYEFTTPTMDTVVTRDHARYYSYSVSPVVNLNGYYFDRISVGGSYGAVDQEISSSGHLVDNATMESWSWGASFGVEKTNLFVKGLSFGMSVNYSRGITHVIDTTHIYYYGWNKENYRTSRALSGEISMGSAALFEQINKTVIAPWNFDYAISQNHKVTWSGLYRYESQDPEDKLSSDGSGRMNKAGFPGYNYSLITGLSLENHFWDSKIQNGMGVKGYFYHLDADDDGSRYQRLGDDAIEYKNVGYSENLRIKLINRLSVVDEFAIKGGYQHSLRFPTREEVFGDGMYKSSTPNLKPEISDNFTTGAELELFNLPLILKMHLDFTAFYLLMDDRIYWSAMSSVPQPYYNSVGTKTKGFEVDVNVDLNEYLTISYNMTKQDVRSRERDNTYGIDKGLIVPNIPRLYMNFGAEFHIGDLLFAEDFLKLYWLANYTDEYYYSWKISKRQNRVIPSSFSQDLGVEYSILANKLSWSFDVKNFLDSRVYDKYGESKPGRAFATKIRVSI